LKIRKFLVFVIEDDRHHSPANRRVRRDKRRRSLKASNIHQSNSSSPSATEHFDFKYPAMLAGL
jgi:hypothetical protein